MALRCDVARKVHGMTMRQHLRNEYCGAAQHHETIPPDSSVQVCHNWELQSLFLLL